MQIESRFFADETDTRRLIEFLGAANQMSRGYWHPGDLVWALNQTTTFDPRASIRLWENAGELLGFTIHEASNLVTAQIHPRLRAEGRLTTTMFEWAASHTRALLEREGDPEPSIWTKALNSDDATLRVLADQGFARDDYHYLHLRRELSEAPAAAPLPAGMRIKHISDEAEYAQRVELHREVWHPSKVTPEAYRGLRAAPVYRPELDLVAVTEDDEFVSYCIVWFDPVSKRGEFEPVGTKPAYQGRGIAKAVMTEGLRRLRELGATSAIVYSVVSNEASTRLYQSVGFATFDQEHLYEKQL
jgi:mycothiol synthase